MKTALTYPISIVVVAIALIFVMMRWVLPEFGKVYESMGAKLPDLTQIVMDISKIFVEYGWLMIVIFIAVCFGVYKLHEKSTSFQKRIDAMILRLPILVRLSVKRLLLGGLVPLPPCLPQAYLW